MDHIALSPAPGRSKLLFLELLRIIACFGVIVNHTAPDVFLPATPSLSWFSSLFAFFLSKIAVPLFLMITGYTLLDRRDDYKKSFLRLLRIGCSLVFFSAVYFTVYYLKGNLQEYNVVKFFGWILPGPITNAYWYLYMYLGLLLMMPFLQKLVASMEKKDFHVFFILSGFLYAFWPIVVHYIPKLTYCAYFSAPLFFPEICLLLLGCYFKRYPPAGKLLHRLALPGFLACTALNVALTYLEYQRGGGVDYLFFDYYQHLPVMVAGVCVFCYCATLSIGPKAEKPILFVGGLTFGIYLMSDLFVSQFQPLFQAMTQKLGAPALCLLPYQLLVFAAGGIMAWVLKKIPGIRKLL